MKKLIFITVLIYCNATFSDDDLRNERELIKNERTNLAIGWRDNLGYKLPTVGSYELFKIRKSGDGEVIKQNGDPDNLHSIMKNKVTLLSFIYSNCTDTNGCPLATSVFYKIQEKLKNSFLWSTKVSISVTLSKVLISFFFVKKLTTEYVNKK